MKSLVAHSIWLAALVMMSACATTSPEARTTARTPLPPDFGRVYIYRNAQFMGKGLVPHVFIDDIDKGALSTGMFQVCDLKPGEHTITIKGDSLLYTFAPIVLKADVSDGKTLYYRFQAVIADYQYGALTTKWRYGLDAVEEGVAVPELTKMGEK